MIITLLSGLVGIVSMAGAVTVRDRARAGHWRAVAAERRGGSGAP